jgi:hypothetical protein
VKVKSELKRGSVLFAVDRPHKQERERERGREGERDRERERVSPHQEEYASDNQSDFHNERALALLGGAGLSDEHYYGYTSSTAKVRSVPDRQIHHPKV